MTLAAYRRFYAEEIEAACGLRTPALNEKIAAALRTDPMPRLAAFRRDPHEPSAACWLHGERFCLQLDPSR